MTYLLPTGSLSVQFSFRSNDVDLNQVETLLYMLARMDCSAFLLPNMGNIGV